MKLLYASLLLNGTTLTEAHINAKAFQQPSHNHVLLSRAKPLEVPLQNDFAHQRFLIPLTLGTPPRPFNVLLDTGSADLWLPSPSSPGCSPNPCPSGTFAPSDSSSIVDLHVVFNASYGFSPDNPMLGEYYNDTVHIGGVELQQQTFAVAEVPKIDFQSGHWGIMGLGAKTGSTAYQNPWSPIFHNNSALLSPVWEHLYELGHIPKRIFSIFLNAQSAEFGSIIFGGIDSSKHEGELKSVPLNLQGPEKLFTGWGINLTSVSRTEENNGGEEALTSSTFTIKAVLDTGAPNMYLPVALFGAIAKPLNFTMVNTGIQPPQTPYVPCSFRDSSASLSFKFQGQDGEGGPKIKVPYEEIIYPFGLPGNLGEVRDDEGTELCYLGIIPNDGIYLLGATFIRSAYLVYDAEDLVIRMAQAKYEQGYGEV